MYEDEHGDARNLSISLEERRYKNYLTAVYFSVSFFLFSFFFFLRLEQAAHSRLPRMDNVGTKLVGRRPSVSFRIACLHFTRHSIFANVTKLSSFHLRICSRADLQNSCAPTFPPGDAYVHIFFRVLFNQVFNVSFNEFLILRR